MLRLGGKGLPDVNGYGRGDELVVVDITIPSKLSAEEKRLVEQLAQQPVSSMPNRSRTRISSSG